MRAKLREVKDELRLRMHQIPEQGQSLKQVVTGFFAYHAVPTNSAALSVFRYHEICLWRRSLRRPSQKDGFKWRRMTKLADDWLPLPRILHPWPHQRFAVKHPSWEPYAGCDRKAGMSLPVKVWSVQSRAGGTGASFAGVAATRDPKRRQRLDGVWN